MNNTHRNVRDFHVRRVAHVVNMAVKECLRIVRDIFNDVRALINSFFSSVKRRDIYDQVCVELGLSHKIRSLDVGTSLY